MRRAFTAVFVLLLLAGGAGAQRGGVEYANPVVAGDHPDPSVIRVGGEYWAAVTTGSWAPHFTLLRSRDLVNWETAGAVFDKKPAWAARDFWAPELIEDKGRVFVYYTARRDEGRGKTGKLCVAVATAARPAGPYTDRGPLVCEIRERGGVGSIDAFFVRDERGEPYLVWKADGNDAEPDQPTSIYAQRLSEDGVRLLGRRREILRNTEPWERHVTEGSFILRRGDWFYHFYSGNACCGRECDYALGVARARRLFGPWEKHPGNPLVTDNKDWQCPGHGSIVSTPDGRDFLLYHSYRRRPDTFAVGREALLDEVRWGADGWPSINGGRGPSSIAPAPLGVAGRDESEFFDDFKGPQLGPEWQWPVTVKSSARVEQKTGLLLLSSAGSSSRGNEWISTVVGRRTLSGDYEAITGVSIRDTWPEARPGLSAYGWRDGAVGVTIGGGHIFIWRHEGQARKTLAVTTAPIAAKIYLRMRAEGGETYRFAYSADGRVWTELGGPVAGGHIEGAHVALTMGGQVGTWGAFDWIRITPPK